MPRLSARRAFLNDIEAYLESRGIIRFLQITMMKSNWDEGIIEEMEDLWEIHELVSEKRYLMDRTLSAGRHEGDILYRLIYDYPDSAFLTMFRMHPDAFWKIVELLTPYWKKTERTWLGSTILVRC